MKRRIMIIEDEPDVAETLKLLLESNGYEAEYYLNPKQAIKEVNKYDLILLDIMVPTMSGREVLAKFNKMKLKNQP